MIKRREEVIQLLTIDPQVYGELLMHCRRGSKDDEEPLRDRCPLRQSAGKCLQIGSCGIGTCGGGKSISWTPLGFLGFQSIYRGGGRSRRCLWASLPIRARQRPLARPGVQRAPQASSRVLQKLPGSLLAIKKFRGIWTSFGIYILQSKKQAKQQLALGTKLIGQSQKMI